MNDLRIIFMGTPEFAVPSLKALVDAGKNIVAVITAEDKPQGRGQKLGISPVKEYAVKNNLRVLQPPKLKDPDFLNELKNLNANLQVVVAFRMLPEVVWSMPEFGTFNLHASLLPQYRGAAPINWAIINGETKTGVTTFFLKQEIDTGEIILQEEEEIKPDDNVGSLYGRLMDKGASLVLKTVELIEKGSVNSIMQAEDVSIKHAPKIFKETCQIDWTETSNSINNFIRGLNPYPGAWTIIGGKQVKIFNVNRSEQKKLKPGEIKTDQKTFINVGCNDGAISIVDFQLEGKRRMSVEDFFKGNKLEV